MDDNTYSAPCTYFRSQASCGSSNIFHTRTVLPAPPIRLRIRTLALNPNPNPNPITHPNPNGTTNYRIGPHRTAADLWAQKCV